VHACVQETGRATLRVIVTIANDGPQDLSIPMIVNRSVDVVLGNSERLYETNFYLSDLPDLSTCDVLTIPEGGMGERRFRLVLAEKLSAGRWWLAAVLSPLYERVERSSTQPGCAGTSGAEPDVGKARLSSGGSSDAPASSAVWRVCTRSQPASGCETRVYLASQFVSFCVVGD